MNTSAEQTEAIRKTMEAEKQASRDELVGILETALMCLLTQCEFAATVRGGEGHMHPAMEMARAALRKAGAL